MDARLDSPMSPLGYLFLMLHFFQGIIDFYKQVSEKFSMMPTLSQEVAGNIDLVHFFSKFSMANIQSWLIPLQCWPESCQLI